MIWLACRTNGVIRFPISRKSYVGSPISTGQDLQLERAIRVTRNRRSELPTARSLLTANRAVAWSGVGLLNHLVRVPSRLPIKCRRMEVLFRNSLSIRRTRIAVSRCLANMNANVVRSRGIKFFCVVRNGMPSQTGRTTKRNMWGTGQSDRSSR